MKKNIINTIFKKGKITGVDLGRLFVANACYEVNSLNTEGTQKSAITQEEFNNLVNKVPEAEDIEILNYYVCIINGIKNSYNVVNANIRNICYYLEKFRNIPERISLLTEGLIEKSMLPKIMTQKQFDDIYNKTLKEYLGEKRSFLTIFNDAICLYIIHYSNDIENYKENPKEYEKPKADKEVDKIIEKYDNTPIKNKALLEFVKEQFNDVDYDSVIFNRTYIDTCAEFLKELEYRNIKIDKTPIKDIDLNQKITKDFIEKILTPEQITDYKILIEHHTAETETEFTQFDLIDSFLDYLLSIDETEDENKPEVIRYLDLILKELPELKEFILNKLSKNTLLKDCANFSIKDYLSIDFAIEDLIKANVLDYEMRAKDLLPECEYPTGIAILKEETLRPYISNKSGFINAKGSFEEKPGFVTNEFKLHEKSIEEVLEQRPEGIDFYKSAGLEHDILFVKAHNKFVDLFKEISKVPDLEVFKHPLGRIEEAINNYNNTILSLLNDTLIHYRQVDYTKAEALREKILELLPYFRTIDDIEIKERSITIAKKALKDRGIVLKSPAYMKTLFTLVEGE